MPRHVAYSFRDDPNVPPWNDRRPLVVFDGVCVLCTWTARAMICLDRQERFLFTTAQSTVGQALYGHYGLDTRDFETNLVIVDGLLYRKSGAVIAALAALGLPWNLARALLIVPRPLRDAAYGLVARNRYALFGRRDQCLMPTDALRARFLE